MRPPPQNALDVESFFCDALGMKPSEVEAYFEFVDWPGKLGARFKRYLPTGFDKLMALVKEWSGEYDRDRRQFVIPKPTAKDIPAQPPKTTDVRPGAEIPRFTFLPTESVLSMPFQSRISIEEPELADLAASMQEHGILEPILVRRKPSGDYELVAGHRRLNAAKQAGITQVPCIIREMTDQQAMEAHFIENLQRKDLSDYEKARMLDYLLKHFPEEYPTQEVLAFKVGKTQAWVSYHLAMLELEKDKIITRVIKPEELTEGQARAILEAPEEKRVELTKHIAEHIKREGALPSMREIKKFVDPEAGEPTTATPREEPEPTTAGQQRRREVPEIKPEEIDTGFEWECPDCQEKFQLIHVNYPDGTTKHKLEAKA